MCSLSNMKKMLCQTSHVCMSSEIQKSSAINPSHISSLFSLLQLAPECNLYCLKAICEAPLQIGTDDLVRGIS